VGAVTSGLNGWEMTGEDVGERMGARAVGEAGAGAGLNGWEMTGEDMDEGLGARAVGEAGVTVLGEGTFLTRLGSVHTKGVLPALGANRSCSVIVCVGRPCMALRAALVRTIKSMQNEVKSSMRT
jgi:hypothetical protein